ncbi:hypothetical protein GCM10027614_25190 [Micromonospora vulcania]
MNVEATGYLEHTLYSDILLTRWMTSEKISFDSYNDTDLHLISDWSTYDAVVLGSHPEYWSEAMRQHMITYVASGGRLIYSGGNGVYERVSFSADRSQIDFRTSTGTRDTYEARGLPASQLLGVNYIEDSWFTFAPYTVAKMHPLLAGTGLSVGDQFGQSGYNGGASGWEVDSCSAWKAKRPHCRSSLAAPTPEAVPPWSSSRSPTAASSSVRRPSHSMVHSQPMPSHRRSCATCSRSPGTGIDRSRSLRVSRTTAPE